MNKHYEPEFKKKIVHLHLEEGRTILIYGSTPDDVFKTYKDNGIEILQFDSDFNQSRKVV